MSKIVVIGLDGGDFSILNPLMKKGDMPNLKKIIETGAYGYLNSTIPNITIPAWPCFATGKHPGKLGIYNFLTLKEHKYEFKLANSSLIQGSAIWDILTKNNKKSLVVNIPLTYPPYQINGIMVSGMTTPSDASEYTYPKNIKQKIKNELGEGLKSKTYMDVIHSDDFKEKLIAVQTEVTEKLFKTVDFLSSDEEFLIFLVRGTDILQHFLFDDFKENEEIYTKLEKYYNLVDSYIGKLIEKDDNVIVISDHGFRRIDVECRTNNWLIKEGYLNIKKEKSLFLKLGISRISLLKFFKKLKIPYKIIPEKFRKKIPLKESEKEFGNSLVDYVYQKRIDWGKTKAICSSDGIYLNTMKREKGTVSNEDYEILRTEIMNKLKMFFKEQGFSIDVFKREEVYDSGKLHLMPDIILYTDKENLAFSNKITKDRKIFSEASGKIIGTHRRKGILMATGPDIKKSKIENADLIDITPTILKMLKIDIPKDMDGKVLKEMLK